MIANNTTFYEKIEPELNRMYKTLLPKVGSFIMKNGGSADDVKDIFQECLMKLVVKFKEGTFNTIKELDSYLMVACMNAWKTEASKKGKNIHVELNENSGKWLEEKSADNQLLKAQKTKLANSILDKIGEKCKELLLYYHFDQISMREIAFKMGFANEQVAKATNYKCKQKLLEQFDAKTIKHLLHED